MELDDEVCLCFHVTKRKLEAYLNAVQPSRASQLSDCGSAGTGCGWCVSILRKMFDRHQELGPVNEELPSSFEYAQQRQAYLKQKEPNDEQP